MKKLLLLFALLATTLSSNADVAINSTNFPDETFRSYLTNHMPGGSDGVFTDAEIAAITEIDMNGWQQIVHNVEGVQYFTNLRKLRLSANANITKIPLRGLTHLTYLECVKYSDGIDMTEDPDLYDCTELDTLILRGHHMTSLDLSRQTKLKYLDVSRCNLTALDLSHNLLLEYLDMSYDELTSRSLDASMFPNLKELNCGYCKLTALNVTGCTKLEKLFCQWNAFDMTQLDLSTNTALVEMNCESSYGSGVLNLSNQPNLTTLTAKNCNLMGLICANVGNLVYLDVNNNNGLATLELQGATKLEELKCANCGITSLVVPENVRELTVSYCPNLTNLVLGHNEKIEHVFFSNTPALTTLDISNCPNLIQLVGGYTGLPEVDFSGCPKLQNFEAGMDLNLKRVDFSQNPNMWSINLSSCYNLEELILPPAIISGHPNTQLERIYIGATQHIKHLNLTNYNGIKRFDASYSALEDVKFGAGLNTINELNLTYSRVSQLDLSNVTRFYEAPTLDAHVDAPVYNLDGKLYVKINPKYSSFDPNRVSDLKVNKVARSVTVNEYGLLEVGNAGDDVRRVSYKYDTRCDAVLGWPGGTDEPLTNVYLTYSLETYNVTSPIRIVPITPTTFPDYSFRNVVSTQISDDPDWLSLELAESYHKLDLENKGGVFNLEGIQYFCNLDTLWCPNNSVKVFDMSALPNLKVLNCSMNRVSPDYNAMAVVTLLETLPDNDDSWKTLYYRSERTGEYNATLTYDQCQYLKSKHWMPMEEYKVSGSTYAWREYEGVSEAYGITFNNGATSVTAANSNDVFGDGTVRFDPIRNMLTLNGFNSTLRNSLSCSRENLLIKLLGDNTMGGTVSFAQNTTIVGPGSLTVSGSTQNLVEFSTSLHITDSARVTIAGSPTAYMGVGIRASSSGKLRVDGLNAQLSISASLYALNNLDSLILGEGYRIVTPVHSEFHGDFGGVQTPSGDYSKEVLIMYAPIYGDANDDSYIDSTDIDAIANILVGKAARTFGADVNCDGDVTISDLTTLSNKIRTPNGTVVNFVQNIAIPQALNMGVGDTRLITATLQPRDADVPAVAWTTSNNSVATVQANGSECTVTAVGGGTCVITCSATDGGGVRATCVVTVTESYVNLGLPSGTLWAKTNVGAETPEEVGTYFAWGETQPKSSYTTSNYFDQNNAIFNNKGGLTELTAEYDAATQQLGSSWQMPSRAQFEELLNEEYTTMEAVTDGSNNIGVKITSKMPGYTDKYIILPLAGEMNGTSLQSVTYAFYRTRNLSNGRYDGDSFVYRGCLYFSGNELRHIVNTSGKWQGQPVRAVRKQ